MLREYKERLRKKRKRALKKAFVLLSKICLTTCLVGLQMRAPPINILLCILLRGLSVNKNYFQVPILEKVYTF